MTIDATSQSLPESVRLVGFATGPFETNCYLLIDTAATGPQGLHPATVIDPGHGAAETVRQLCSQHQCEIAQVVLTHGHIDHIRDAGEFGVPVYLHPADESMLSIDWLQATPFAQIFDVNSMTPIADVRYLDDSIDMAGVAWTVHHLPGHSPGSVAFRSSGVVIGGDVLFRGGVGRTDLPGSSPEDMLLSLKKLATDFSDDDTVLPGHGPQTTIGAEKRSNPFLQAVQ